MYGSFINSAGKGASMMKLPLSETTGPALALAMRSCAAGAPIRCRFCRIFLYAKGTTSIGIPCFHCVCVCGACGECAWSVRGDREEGEGEGDSRKGREVRSGHHPKRKKSNVKHEMREDVVSAPRGAEKESLDGRGGLTFVPSTSEFLR